MTQVHALLAPLVSADPGEVSARVSLVAMPRDPTLAAVAEALLGAGTRDASAGLSLVATSHEPIHAAVVVALLVATAVVVHPPRTRRRRRAWSVGSALVTGHGRGRRARARPLVGAEQIASALVLLALGYRSGLPTWQVLTSVSELVPEEAGRDLRQVAAALQWGASEAEAWGSVDEGWAPAARAVAIAHHAGVPPGPLLLTAADDLRRSELERLEVAAAKVGVRLVAPLGLVLLPAFCLTTVVPLVVALGSQLLEAG